MLNWVNYLSVFIGNLIFLLFMIVTTIVLIRNPKEKINWLFALSFFFIALAYFILPLGAFVYLETSPKPMVRLTETYVFSLYIGLVLLMLGVIAINLGTHYTLKWFILIPTIATIIFIGVLVYFMDSLEAVEGANPDVKTSLLFTVTFYPMSICIVVIVYVFLIKAFKNTTDENVKQCLRFFLIGFSLCVFSLIPNILSNILNWSEAQALNGIEFLIVLLGSIFLFLGFIIKGRKTSNPIADFS